MKKLHIFLVSALFFSFALFVMAQEEAATNVSPTPAPVRGEVKRQVKEVRKEAQDKLREVKDVFKTEAKDARQNLKETVKDKRGELKDSMHDKTMEERKMMRDEFHDRVKVQRQELQDKIKTKREELKENLKKIKDERKKQVVEKIDQGLDTLDPLAGEGVALPTFNISAIVTSVHVESGDVVVLGGLIQDSLANDNISVPILGEIPGVGRLFQKNIKNREKKVLMVFIRPLILRTEANTVYVSGAKYNDTRLEQLNISRSQEAFDPRNSDSVLKPLREAKLPRPFHDSVDEK